MPEYTYRVAPRSHHFNLLEDDPHVMDLTDTIDQVTIEQYGYNDGRPVPVRFGVIKSGYELVFTAVDHPLNLWARIKTWFGHPPKPLVTLRINTQTADGSIDFQAMRIPPFAVVLKVKLVNLNRRRVL